MALRFSLAALLRLREIAEQREERLFTQILKQIALSRQTLADLQVQRRTIIAQRESAMESSTPAYDLAGFYSRVRAVDDLERTGTEQLAQLDRLRDKQMKVYEAAHRDREVLSTMRLKQAENYQREQVRQEQNRADDTFSARRNVR